MRRTLIMRGLALIPVLIISAVWVRSYFTSSFVTWGRRTSTTTTESIRGNIEISRTDLYKGEWPEGWTWGEMEVQLQTMVQFDRIRVRIFQHDLPPSNVFRLLGFGYAVCPFPDDAQEWRVITLPYWFFDVLAALLALYVWRKTRPAPNPATAFPVEIKKD
jgi:hypothetical protein